MDLQIKNKIALVTASSAGLGRGCAATLAQEGCHVAICSRHRDNIEQTAREINDSLTNANSTSNTNSSAGKTPDIGSVTPFVADMADPDSIAQLIADVRVQLGHPDILITNAGGPPPGTFDSTDPESFPTAVNLNMMSAIRLTYACVPAMKNNRWGRIVMITSASVKQPIPNIILSNTARAGLTGFMKTTATELAPHGITVNALLPGMHDTDRVNALAQQLAKNENRSVDEVRHSLEQKNPTRRMGTIAEFGATAAFLCSQQAAYITGTNILADGGAYPGLI